VFEIGVQVGRRFRTQLDELAFKISVDNARTTAEAPSTGLVILSGPVT
jgi:hypothetical protein